jgi:hypothetical protein
MRSTTASQPQKRTQTGASSNLHFTCFIFQYISLGLSIFQQSFYSRDSEELTKNNQGTTKEQKEQGKCSFRALILVVPNSFSSCYHALTISLSQYITHLLIILTHLSFRALIRRSSASNKTFTDWARIPQHKPDIINVNNRKENLKRFEHEYRVGEEVLLETRTNLQTARPTYRTILKY